MMDLALPLLSVCAVSLISLVGLLTLSMAPARLQRLASAFMAFAVGALLGDAFIHLVPETFASRDAPLPSSLWLLTGLLGFFVVEKLVRHRAPRASGQPPIAALSVIGDAIHNFIDGVVIGASYSTSTELGVSTTLAVLLHELPQELGDFGVLIHSGVAPRRAVLLNLASASIAIAGTAVALVAGDGLSNVLVPITAGGFVYLAAADLIPELQRDSGTRSLLAQSLLISAGVAVMAILALIE